MNSNGHKNGTITKEQHQLIEEMLPHSPEAESAVLGGILIDQDAYYEVSDYLQAAHFHNAFNAQIYKAIACLLSDRMPADMVTVGETLRAWGKRPVKGEVDEYLASLVISVPTSVNTAHYARIVESLAIRRRTIHAGYKLRALANDTSLPISSLISQSEEAVFGVADGLSDNRMIPISESARALYDLVVERRENGGQFVGIPSGLVDLDRILRGFKPSRFYILAGRPGMGKSALANKFALSMAGKYGKRGAIFNLEMSASEVNQRFAAHLAKVDLQKVEEGRLNDDEFTRFQVACGKMGQLSLFMDDSTHLTPSRLRAKCRRLHSQHGLDFVIIDYLQLMVDDNRHGSREREVAEMSRQIKRLAKDLEVPIITLAQLSRALESRQDKRPVLSDLRESGDIENNADCVMFLYRDDYYAEDKSLTPNTAEIAVRKHRMGPTGIASAWFDGSTMTFANLAR